MQCNLLLALWIIFIQELVNIQWKPIEYHQAKQMAQYCIALHCGLYFMEIGGQGRVREFVIFHVTNSHTNVNPSDWLIRTWPGLLDHTLVGVTQVTVCSVEVRVFYASFLVDCKMDIKCELLQITGFKSELNGPLSLTFSIAAIYTRFGIQLCFCRERRMCGHVNMAALAVLLRSH